MKWLAEYITDFGIDGYRVDTVKHTEEYVWQEFKEIADYAFAEYKRNNTAKVLDDNEFYLVGEVYNYSISHGREFDFGDKKVDYFDNAFNSLINFEFKWNAQQQDPETVFSRYDNILSTTLGDYGVMNYLTSHDDHEPYDKERKKSIETANILLLGPGTAQVYYGDESARPLIVEGANGDANLRSNMNWDEISSDNETAEILEHWQKLGKFRAAHPAVGAGRHNMISQEPYYFSRTFTSENFQDVVVIGIDLPTGKKVVNVSSVFENGDKIMDIYSNISAEVKEGRVEIDSEYDILLLEKI